MPFTKTLKRYWQAFLLWRGQEKLRRERERLDQEVRKRQKEAAELGITEMLLDVYRNGYRYQPWISNFQADPPTNSVTFLVKGKSYIIKSEEHINPFDYKTRVTITLHENGKELFRDSFTEDADQFGLTYDINKYGFSIAAYAPGEWVKNLRDALDAAAEQEKENASKARHSRAAIDDLKGRFGL